MEAFSRVGLAMQALRLFVGCQMSGGAGTLVETIQSLLKVADLEHDERTFLQGMLGAMRVSRLASKLQGMSEEDLTESLWSSDWSECCGAINLIKAGFFPEGVVTPEILKTLVDWMLNPNACPAISSRGISYCFIQEEIARAILQMHKSQAAQFDIEVLRRAGDFAGEEVQFALNFPLLDETLSVANG